MTTVNVKQQYKQQYEEKLGGVQSQLDALRDRRQWMDRLQNSPDFRCFLDLLIRDFTVKRRQLLAPPEDVGAEQKRTYIAGEAFGLQRALHLLDTELAAAEQQIKALEQQETLFAGAVEGMKEQEVNYG